VIQEKSNFPSSNSNSTLLVHRKALSFFILHQKDIKIGIKLGEGGFGVVYRGDWQGNAVAIKKLSMNRPLSEKEIDDFQQEMELMSMLHHPQIVRFFGGYLQDEFGHPSYGIVMEYCLKGSLSSVLHFDHPLAWTVRIAISYDIARGLLFLHNKGIIHRDLKSANVLLDKEMNAKLTDFGLSYIKQESRKTTIKTGGQAKGTLEWMAPELFQKKVEYSTQTDMYSFGVTLWEIASRKLPFDGEDSNRVISFHLTEQIEEIPKECEKEAPKIALLIKQCWQKDPKKRITAKEAVDELTPEKPKGANVKLAQVKMNMI